MSIVLPPEFEEFVQRQVSSGAYGSQQEVLQTALSLLKRRQVLLAHIDEGTEDLRSGRYVEYGKGDRDRFVRDIATGSQAKSLTNPPE
jgi:putative addiction module CopG family antidote